MLLQAMLPCPLVLASGGRNAMQAHHFAFVCFTVATDFAI